MDFIEVSARTVDDAITEACEQLSVTSDRLYYDIISEGSNGFLGINAKPAVIKAAVKEETKEETTEVPSKKDSDNESDVDYVEVTKKFLSDIFSAMKMDYSADVSYNEKDSQLDVKLEGADMGVLIGKRGQTLDSLQYLVSLVVNREAKDYIHVKVDTEDYRERRRATLENLASNIGRKVKKTRQPVSLEPMNPYERKIIHSALQNDKFVTTHSEGEEPYRRVVVTLKK